jgi:apolipoprotein N-acyltransferase
MDPLTTLRSVGLTLPSPAYIFGAIVFGLIGFVAYRRGKAAERKVTLWLGVALMVYPYGVSGTPWLYAVGFALCAALYVYRG